MTLRRTLLMLPVVCVVWPALGQQAPTTRIRGTIDSISGTSMQVTTRGGEQLRLAVDPKLRVTEIVPVTLGEVGPGSYIGTAAVPQPDGTLRALEIQVFPEAQRGVGEGTHPWDLAPQSTMLNGTVGDVVGTQGRTLTVKYKGGEKTVVVPETAPVITYQPGTEQMLVPGAHVIITASKAADGALTATRVNVGKNGLVPPM